MSIRLIIYVVVIPLVCLLLIVFAVLSYVSPFSSSPTEREKRFVVELRGAHLVWWLAWAMVASVAFSGWAVDLPRCVFGSFVAVAIGGVLAKLWVPLVGSSARCWSLCWYGKGYEIYKRYFLFWARGIVPVAIALAPGLAYILWCLASGGLAGRAP